MQKWTSAIALCVTVVLTGCGQSASSQTQKYVTPETPAVLVADGKWLTTSDGNVMLDPQTSGLTVLGEELVSISDGSAHESQQRKLHYISTQTSTVRSDEQTFSMASRVRRSCFYGYLSDEPDLEALVTDPDDDSVMYTVTEDATRTGALSPRCQQRFEKTGSTDYPTLIVRLKRDSDGSVMMTHVRPLQYPDTLAVGDFPNDGIEGMAMDDNRTLYLGLEKDAAGKARIFSLTLDEDFWKTDDFAVVSDPQLSLPPMDAGNHPINGLAWYKAPGSQQGFLLAAARNDNELWIVPTDKRTSKRIAMKFTAPTAASDGSCPALIDMDNASIEGLVVFRDKLWLINDPWKKNYMKNVVCEADTPWYEAMAPLLFSVDMDTSWFE